VRQEKLLKGALAYFATPLLLMIVSETHSIEAKSFVHHSRYGLEISLSRQWHLVDEEKKQTIPAMRDKPGEYFLRTDPIVPNEQQVFGILKVSGQIPASVEARCQALRNAGKSPNKIESCGSFRFPGKVGIYMVQDADDVKFKSYALQLNPNTMIHFVFSSRTESFSDACQEIEDALRRLTYR